ncbi:MAG: nuclear transport factor 2 family protein, partial [Gemmatimonadales bacterium]
MKSTILGILITVVASGLAAAQDAADNETDKEGVVRAALDYMEGAVTADADRVARGVHSELTKVVVRTLPQTGRQSLAYNTRTTLVEVVRGLAERMAEVDKNVEVTVFDVGNDLAAARAVGALWYDYLQLAKLDGEWKIVNVLWSPNQPGTTGREPDDFEVARSEVERTALDYIEGAYSGDPERMERALHPELTKVLLNRHRQTGEQFLYKMG